eukprot:445993-Rhodomonas_salina.2
MHGTTDSIHCREIKYKKPRFQYNLYQNHGLWYLISQCKQSPGHTWRVMRSKRLSIWFFICEHHALARSAPRSHSTL